MDNRLYHIWANSGGCPQNQLDGAHAAAWLEGQGFRWTDDPEQAGVVLINGCSYQSLKEDETVAAALRIRSVVKPDATIIVTGCLPKIAPRRTQELFGDLTVIPGTDLGKLAELFPDHTRTWDEARPNSIPDPLFRYAKPFRRFIASGLGVLRQRARRPLRRHLDRLLMYDHSPRSYLVRIAEGCLGSCTYCAIRFARGKLVSRPAEEILAEVRRGVERGVDEILLTATELAGWGRDRGTDLAELLTKILALPGDFDLLLFYANPRWMVDIWDRLEPCFASGRIAFLHMSLNGGSDPVLRRMGRGYTLAEFESLVGSIRTTSPGTVLQTQVVTGFPGETDEDFRTTLGFFQRNYFHNVQVHAFDPRPGTAAALLPNAVPPSIGRKRRIRLYAETLTAKLRWDLFYLVAGKERNAIAATRARAGRVSPVPDESDAGVVHKHAVPTMLSAGRR